MGLDMYLYVEKEVSFLNWTSDKNNNDDFLKLVEISKTQDLVNIEHGYIQAYVKIQVGYWRKANEIHKFFVDNCANGVDNCEEVYVSRDNLEKLLNICNEVLKDKDPEVAKELLPTQDGFFFGNTDYDEWYFEGLEYTRSLVYRILEKTPKDYKFTYRASW